MGNSEDWMEESGASSPPRLEEPWEDKPQSSGLRLLIRWTLICGLVGYLMAAAYTYVLPRKFESVAVVQILPPTPELDPFGGQMGHPNPDTGMTPQFFATEFEVFVAEQTLQRVVERLDLTARWLMDPGMVIEILKGCIATWQAPGTDLLEIRVRHTNADDARDIAEKIVEAYRERRTGMERDRVQRALSSLDAELRDQEDLVEERRKILHEVSRSLAVPVHAAPSGEERTQWAGEALRGLQLRVQEHKEKTRLMEVEMKILLELKNEELLRHAMGRGIPPGLGERWSEHRTEANVLASYEEAGLPESDGRLVRQRAKVKALAKQIEEVAAGMRGEMRTRLQIAEKQLEVMRAEVDDLRNNTLEMAIEAGDWIEAKREYESALAMLKSMKLQHSTTRIALRIPKSSILIHEEPKRGKNPVWPSVTTNLTNGAVKGAGTGLILAVLILGWRKFVSGKAGLEDEEEEWA